MALRGGDGSFIYHLDYEEGPWQNVSHLRGPGPKIFENP